MDGAGTDGTGSNTNSTGTDTESQGTRTDCTATGTDNGNMEDKLVVVLTHKLQNSSRRARQGSSQQGYFENLVHRQVGKCCVLDEKDEICHQQQG